MPHRHVVLAVEDDPDDVLLMRVAFDRAGLGKTFCHVRDAAEAMRYLEGEAPYADRATHPIPTLLVLDIKLPGMNGFEFLAWLRADPRFGTLPVVLNSSSDKSHDVQKAAKLGATKFLAKTPNYQSLVKLVQELPSTPPANILWALAPIQQREVWKAAVMRDYLGK